MILGQKGAFVSIKELTTDKGTNKTYRQTLVQKFTGRSKSERRSSGEILELPEFECFSIL